MLVRSDLYQSIVDPSANLLSPPSGSNFNLFHAKENSHILE